MEGLIHSTREVLIGVSGVLVYHKEVHLEDKERETMKAKLFKASALALILAMLVSSIALADNINNEIMVDTIFVGDATLVGYKVVGTDGDGGPSVPEENCNAADGSKLTLTIHVPAHVSAFGFTLLPDNTLEFTTCNDFQYVSFSASAAGDYPITISYSDSGAGSYSNNADFMLHVNAPAVSDDTPPVLTPNILGTLGANGWYVSDVYVSWKVYDGESPVSFSSGCGITPIEFDTAGTTSTCTAMSAGGTSEQSVTIKRDATAPTITGYTSPAPNDAGWNNTDVAVSFSCDDNLSGVVSCGPDATLSGEGIDQSITGTVVDHAGNSSTATVSGIHIDKTGPSISILAGPEEGASYDFGSVPEPPSEHETLISDNLSGVHYILFAGYGVEVGTHTMAVTAYDNAGNESIASRTYTVLAWTLNGFSQPVDMTEGVWNTVKGGSTVPLKFNVYAGTTELTDVGVVKSFTTTQVACEAGGDEATVDFTTTDDTSLRYDLTTGQFVQNWKTPKATGCYRAIMTTKDLSTIVAFFKLK